jgi:spermidine/putrescine transport system permease protein
MTSRTVLRAVTTLYLGLFFLYLLGPLIVLGLTAFNSSAYPQVAPFESFTLHWFAQLAADDELRDGLENSLRIGVLVVLLAVPLGLAGAIVMQQIHARARSLYYLVVVSPVLTPGVIIGISTVIFWRNLTGLTGTRFLYDGVVLTVLGQTSFIAAWCMLIFLARLQRFDRTLEEAGLDLGAGRTQVFLHILLPFLRPAMLSAAALAFLASFENYNTTTFAILADKTLTTVIAGRVRQGTSPVLSALAVAIIAVTVLGALLYEVLKRREDARKAAERRRAAAAERIELASPTLAVASHSMAP